MIKASTLILGSAAGLIALSEAGHRRADLPVKAKAVEYVQGLLSCTAPASSTFPGTDTCIKLGGYLRADVTFNGGTHGAPAWSGDLGQQNRYRNYFARAFAYGADSRYPHRHRIRRRPHLRSGRLPVHHAGRKHLQSELDQRHAPVGGSQLLDTPGGGYVAVEYRLHPVRRFHLR